MFESPQEYADYSVRWNAFSVFMQGFYFAQMRPITTVKVAKEKTLNSLQLQDSVHVQQ